MTYIGLSDKGKRIVRHLHRIKGSNKFSNIKLDEWIQDGTYIREVVQSVNNDKVFTALARANEKAIVDKRGVFVNIFDIEIIPESEWSEL